MDAADLPRSCPAVFGVLALLLSEADPAVPELAFALRRLEQAFDHGGMPENRIFGPWVLHLLSTRALLGQASSGLTARLRAVARVAAAEALSRDVVLERLARALLQERCEAILLKGAALDHYLYEREAFRQGVDVDLLVRAADFERAAALLASLGEELDDFAGRPAHQQATAQRSYRLPAPLAVELDLHHQYAQQGIYAIDYEELFRRARPHPARPAPYRLLSAEDNLVHFAIHAFKDRQLFQKQTVDAWCLLRMESVDWPILVQRAEAAGALQPLVYLLEGVRQVFGWQPPMPERERLALGGARRRLALWLLTHRPAIQRRTGWRYRSRQLAITWVLSGNRRGYARYQARYLQNRIRDSFGRRHVS